MPVYEYQCKKCGREFEYQQRMADPDKTVCEACGAEALERLISRTAFQLKGSGWYKDLYSSSKPESGSTGTTTAAPADSSSSGTSTGASSDSGSSGTSSGSSGGSSGSSSSGSSSSGSSSGSATKSVGA